MAKVVDSDIRQARLDAKFDIGAASLLDSRSLHLLILILTLLFRSGSTEMHALAHSVGDQVQ